MGRVHHCSKSVILLLAGIVLGGCSKPPAPYNPKVIPTREIVFHLDRRFNSGQPLALVIFFATPENPLKALLAKKVEKLVASQGGSWPYKMMLRLVPGQGPVVRVRLKPPPHPTDIAIMADYLELTGHHGQVVVLSATSSPTEAVFVTGKGIYH